MEGNGEGVSLSARLGVPPPLPLFLSLLFDHTYNSLVVCAEPHAHARARVVLDYLYPRARACVVCFHAPILFFLFILKTHSRISLSLKLESQETLPFYAEIPTRPLCVSVVRGRGGSVAVGRVCVGGREALHLAVPSPPVPFFPAVRVPF